MQRELKFRAWNPDDDFYGTVNYDFITCNCEVIGNIYEHLNLLK
jgi:hypothetical protein